MCAGGLVLRSLYSVIVVSCTEQSFKQVHSIRCVSHRGDEYTAVLRQQNPRVFIQNFHPKDFVRPILPPMSATAALETSGGKFSFGERVPIEGCSGTAFCNLFTDT